MHIHSHKLPYNTSDGQKNNYVFTGRLQLALNSFSATLQHNVLKEPRVNTNVIYRG